MRRSKPQSIKQELEFFLLLFLAYLENIKNFLLHFVIMNSYASTPNLNPIQNKIISNTSRTLRLFIPVFHIWRSKRMMICNIFLQFFVILKQWKINNPQECKFV